MRASPASASASALAQRQPRLPAPSTHHRHHHQHQLQQHQRIPGFLRPQQPATTRRRASSSSSSGAAAAAAAATPITLRPATPNDLEQTRRAVLREAINPLGLDASHTLVAADRSSGAWLGSGQLSRLQRAPWQQQQQTAAAPAYELRSLVVSPDRRGQGIGAQLVRGLLDMAVEEGGASADVFLTTTAARAPFYRRVGGFEECALGEAPPVLIAEVMVGTFVAAVVARQRLVVMRRRV